ncbi:MAG: hypothetical protein P4N59_28620 [Negativicutes bacterium]|nr:hypothetical protein [Negativicutes bacterium]
MKKIIACLLVLLLVVTFTMPAFASPTPAVVGKQHVSGWMKYGRFTLGLAIFLCIVAELSHDKATTGHVPGQK